MDWTGCELVEVVPGKVSGQPVVKGTRVLADTVEQYSSRGATVDEIHEDFPSLSEDTIMRMIVYMNARQASAA
jgi:uncharacterized protein (DUF433 family)